jgi:hypothetical protein
MADGKIDKERQRLVIHYQPLAEKNSLSTTYLPIRGKKVKSRA